MPTYPYRCKACGFEFEEFQAITEDPIEVCPKCGGETHRIISGGAGLIFKGSGFYITDYRKDSYKRDASKDSSSTTAAKASDSKSTSDKKD
ncbi:zinc ribbon domain-containing protein [bacterium]|nr:zinc ribbon domain-containing protein [bacterium]MCB2201700.1 zinc ribbon domain-containing protein [bacterium]